MDLGFNEKVVIITGGSTGIGAATAQLFAREGASVVIADVNETQGQATTQQIQQAGEKAIFIHCDVSNASQVQQMVQQTVSHFGRLDFAFNNAGIEGNLAPIADQDPDAWNKVISVNLTGVFLCMKYQIPEILKNGKGSIVNCASILGLVGFAGAGAYDAAKHGVIGLTQNAALEYSAAGIRINAVAPGFIETPMLERAGILTSPDMRKMVESLHPIGRIGKAEEIAGAVAWLCSDYASFVTGHTLLVDGAYTSR